MELKCAFHKIIYKKYCEKCGKIWCPRCEGTEYDLKCPECGSTFIFRASEILAQSRKAHE